MKICLWAWVLDIRGFTKPFFHKHLHRCFCSIQFWGKNWIFFQECLVAKRFEHSMFILDILLHLWTQVSRKQSSCWQDSTWESCFKLEIFMPSTKFYHKLQMRLIYAWWGVRQFASTFLASFLCCKLQPRTPVVWERFLKLLTTGILIWFPKESRE